MASNVPDLKSFVDPFLCANTERRINGIIKPCENEARSTCVKCKLVQYCSKECQIVDWVSHKAICKSRYLKTPYKPRWQTEKRIPEFMGGPPLAQFGSLQYLWGNVPAIDLLKVTENEGNEAILQQDVSLLFAASGDLRNVVKTINSLPEEYLGSCKTFINDKNTTIVMRNALLLLVALQFEPEVATPIMLHLWYSAMLPQSIVEALQKGILPRVRNVCDKIEMKLDNSMQAKTFVHGKGSVRLVLKKSEWTALAKMLEPSKELTAPIAQAIRRKITQARVDHIDRSLGKMPLGRRAGAIDFRQHGILLPFGASRKDFVVPNPTLFAGQTWPMKDDADPLDGWSSNEYMKFATTATSDAYGAFFFYLRHLLLAFCKRVRSLAVSFQLLGVDAVTLPNYLTDVSNICDRGYIGPSRTMSIFSHLLKPKSQNPRAALLLLFLNIVREENDETTTSATMAHRSRMVRKFFSDMDPRLVNAGLGKGGLESMQYITTPEVVLLTDAMTYWDDFDIQFARFLEDADPASWKPVSLKELAARNGLIVRDKHTIMPPWPYRASEHMSREEFNVLLAESTCGHERYVELSRA
ncbi:hypothetical protein DE146DRAFT_761995 [Phaeosphaeria sp. MPI-PUGE-AT-0046c]|nr:hypothetical protein DE146DRAFT_761995 [Phaeosphaeria sp. MPI-PUGE-AT-0046c]